MASMSYAACWRSAVACVPLLVGLPCVARGQETSFFYVVRATGNWVAGRDTEPLRPLQRVGTKDTIRIRSGSKVDSTYVIVLRDPRTLRTATWACKPVARCSARREAAQLSFATLGMTTSPRTASLFLRLSDDEERSRAKMVGARGSELHLGLFVLAADSARVDARPLGGGIDTTGGAKLVARFCRLTSDRPRTDCRTSPSDECALSDWAHCTLPRVTQPRAVAIEILARDQASRSADPVARAVGIVTTPANHARVAALAQLYTNDLAAIRAQLTDEEFRALHTAAALAIAQSRD